MFVYLIESIIGLVTGMFLGMTGIIPSAFILIVLDILKIGDYKSNLGAIMMLNLFPLTIGSVYQFYKANKLNVPLGIILLITVSIGSFIGSKFVVGEKSFLSTKNVKYITSITGFLMGFILLYSAYYEKN